MNLTYKMFNLIGGCWKFSKSQLRVYPTLVFNRVFILTQNRSVATEILLKV